MFRNIANFIAIIILVMPLCSCTYFHVNPSWAKNPDFPMESPPGPPEYRQGFMDGCESGYSGYANSFNKMFWTWKQDPKLAENQMYYRIWKDAYSYCALLAMAADEHGLGNWR